MASGMNSTIISHSSDENQKHERHIASEMGF
jgi:hypothetical protein